MNIKLFTALLVVFVLLSFWIIPKTKFAKKLKMNEKLFYLINIIGIACGVAGFIASLFWGELILTHHYFELILMPAFLIYLYSGIIMKVKGKDNLYDEKQNFDMTRAAAMTLPFTIAAMFLLYAMFKETILSGLVWFPLYVYISLTVFAAGSIFFFRKE